MDEELSVKDMIDIVSLIQEYTIKPQVIDGKEYYIYDREKGELVDG